MDINELSNKISKDFTKSERQARTLLKVFICGSHKTDKDKKCIEELCDELKDKKGKFRIPGTFIMEHIKTRTEMKFHQKFDLIWDRITEGPNVPLCLLFAGKSASKSQGLNSEIQNTAKDQIKKQNTILIRLEGVELTHYADEFPYHTVKSNSEFKKLAKNLVIAKLNEVKSFLFYKNSLKKSGRNEKT